MAALLIMLNVMAIALTMLLPAWQTMSKREREAELIFRGQQYARAVALYQRSRGAFPPSVDVLVNEKFLRKKYKDPMSDNGDFQVIVVGAPIPGGVTPPVVPGGGGPGGTQQGRPGGSTGFGSGSNAGRTGGGLSSGLGGGPSSGLGGGAASGLGGGAASGFGGGAASGLGSQSGAGSGFGAGTGPGMNSGAGAGSQAPTSGFNRVTREGSMGTTGPILGVVSKSTQTSLRLFNGRNKYNEWAFVATEASAQAGGVAGAPTPGGVGTQAPGMGNRGGQQTPGMGNRGMPQGSTAPPLQLPGMGGGGMGGGGFGGGGLGGGRGMGRGSPGP